MCTQQQKETVDAWCALIEREPLDVINSLLILLHGRVTGRKEEDARKAFFRSVVFGVPRLSVKYTPKDNPMMLGVKGLCCTPIKVLFEKSPRDDETGGKYRLYMGKEQNAFILGTHALGRSGQFYDDNMREIEDMLYEYPPSDKLLSLTCSLWWISKSFAASRAHIDASHEFHVYQPDACEGGRFSRCCRFTLSSVLTDTRTLLDIQNAVVTTSTDGEWQGREVCIVVFKHH
jgi:hypothetical protein